MLVNVGGVLTLDSLQGDYGYNTEHATRTSSLALRFQQLGAFAAYFAAWPLTARIGRRKALMLLSAVFCIGAVIQTVNTHSLPAFYVARVITSLGLGAATVVVPMFNGEMMLKELRGRVGSFFQLFFTLEAWEGLKWVRGSDSQETQDEMEEIRVGVENEARAMEGVSTELLQTDNFKRISTAFAVFTAQQATGATAFAYFGPQFFKLLIGGGDRDLLLTAIFDAVNVPACSTFVLFLADRVGRRAVLIGGVAFMAACQITTAAVVKATPPPEGGKVTSSGIATVALIYLFVIAYNFRWGPLPWPYIFPARIRESGVAIGVASQWLFNFRLFRTTPYMRTNMGPSCSFLFLKESRGFSLETIGHQRFAKGSSAEATRLGEDVSVARDEHIQRSPE
ncbi:quinate permease [Phialemonium atrogriseum]|uniref:Quinate permease n=1 Tax=Phialemonium atrogriseum TaxID=1093897 RepID=A0AAJ0BZZ3_9PEZI|nr:quinate permease [Phialemonium atrogriseum]KAK1766937.1 quinate permease [Phialemonium atrogriseum]